MQPNQGARKVEAGHHLFETHAFITDHVRGWYFDIIEEDGTTSDDPGTDILEGRAANPWLPKFNQKRGNAVSALLLRV